MLKDDNPSLPRATMNRLDREPSTGPFRPADDAHPANPGEPPESPGPSPRLPRAAVGRMSLYFRELHRLLDSGVASINSRELGRLVDVSPAVVRRDLSALGTIGRRGVGYSIGTLIGQLGKVLGSGVRWGVVLVGVGSLGNALLRYRGFSQLGFELCAAFDVDPRVIGSSIGGICVRPLDQLRNTVEETKPELAILAVPASEAQEVAAKLAAAGIRGILNFAPATIRAGGATAIVNVDLASELQRLAFTVRHLPR